VRKIFDTLLTVLHHATRYLIYIYWLWARSNLINELLKSHLISHFICILTCQVNSLLVHQQTAVYWVYSIKL
jgi:hypothetical protein